MFPGDNRQTVCKPGSVPSKPKSLSRAGHSSGTFVTERLARPTRAAARKARPATLTQGQRRLPLLLGLAPGGVYPAAAVAGGAVRSYRTISPLPPAAPKGGRARRCVSVALSLGSPPPGVTRHRASVEPGLSSLRRANSTKSGHPTVWLGRFGMARPGCQTAQPVPHESATTRNALPNSVLRSIETRAGGVYERSPRSPDRTVGDDDRRRL